MNDWNLLINFAWPHERLTIGWEIMQPTENDDYYTVTVYLLVVAIQVNWV